MIIKIEENMKKSIFLVAVFVGLLMSGCIGKQGSQGGQEAEADTLETELEAAPTDTVVTDADVKQSKDSTFRDAIERYLVESIGSQYTKGDFCVPYYTLVNTDLRDANNVKVWGDFWVAQYKLVGDTLKTVSGGSHPGLIHLKKVDHRYKVTAFDQVVDGAGNQESAKKIFGEYYEAFQAANSNEVLREHQMLKMVGDYVKKHDIKATLVQDYGWPAKQLPR